MTFDPAKMAAMRDQQVPAEWNRLTERIIGAAIEVHSHLGPGLREKLYEHAMLRELTLRGLRWAQQVPFRVLYKDHDLGLQIVDTIVEDLVVLEFKAASVTEIDKAQLVGYLRFTGLPLGLLINFHVSHLKDGITRRINWPPQGASVAIRSTSAISPFPPTSSASSVSNSAASVFSS